jgi:hypothetical protein
MSLGTRLVKNRCFLKLNEVYEEIKTYNISSKYDPSFGVIKFKNDFIY